MNRNDALLGTQETSSFVPTGILLRETREKAALTLQEVAEVLKIRDVYLHAIEEGRFQILPGGPYVSGFVRSYAEYLGLDGQEIVRRFHREGAFSQQKSGAELEFLLPDRESSMPSLWVIGLALLLGVGVYLGWEWSESPGRFSSEGVRSFPEKVMALLRMNPDSPMNPNLPESQESGGSAERKEDNPSGVEQAQPEIPQGEGMASAGLASTSGLETVERDIVQEEPLAVVASEEAASASPITEDGTVIPSPGNERVGETALSQAFDSGAESVPSGGGSLDGTPADISPDDSTFLGGEKADSLVLPSEPPSLSSRVLSLGESSLLSVSGEGNGESRVIVHAREDAWVQVRFSSGQQESRLLKKGESLRLPNDFSAELMTGNAGGTVLEVDGEMLEPVGKRGEVRRGILLDPETLKKRVW